MLYINSKVGRMSGMYTSDFMIYWSTSKLRVKRVEKVSSCLLPRTIGAEN